MTAAVAAVTPEAVWRALLRQPAGALETLAGQFGCSLAQLCSGLAGLHDAGVPVHFDASLYWCEPAPCALALPQPGACGLDLGELHFSLVSTQDRARELARTHPGQRLLVAAEQQSGGRGRLGRRWQSPLGAHLYITLAWPLALPPARCAGLSLAVGASLAATLDEFGVAVWLKWPNDLYLAGRKLGGVLVELQDRGSAGCTALLGIGLNHRMSPAHVPDQPWIDLAAACWPLPSRTALLARLLQRLAADLARFEADGLAPFLDLLNQRNLLAGQEVELLPGPGSEAGSPATAAAIGSDGRLQVQLADGSLQAVLAGEVQLRRAPPQPWQLLLDCGNTRLKWASTPLATPGVLLPGGALALRAADGSRLPPTLVAARLRAVVAAAGLPAPAALRLASTWGGDRAAFSAALRGIWPAADCSELRTPTAHGRWRNAYARSERLGIDRALAMHAALPLLAAGESALLVSAGSALTLDLLDADGAHRGGLIAPSAVLMQQALAALSPRLDPAGGRFHELAADSADAVVSASHHAAAGLVERIWRRSGRPRLLLGGGGAGPLAALLDLESRTPQLEPDLVLRGLAGWDPGVAAD